ncbi:MAG: RNase adapter RapZ [Deltaproteobacteria bacterium]|nr:RNase adapter RapZ [Deltaproteobacteria bacterium]
MPDSDPAPQPEGRQVVIVTGLSGAGKSTAIHVLEDLGFYCIDNLPVALISRFLELCANCEEPITRVAFGIDQRERMSLRNYPNVLAELRQRGQRVEVLYFEATDAILTQRFSETRRPHPGVRGGSVAAGIQFEREHLAELRQSADQIIDTSTYTVHELREQLRHRLATPHAQPTLLVTVQSFGYKHGVPIDADLMFDLRFLANPFFVEDLRPKTGKEADVAAYVLQRPEAETFLTQVSALLQTTLPLYLREGKSYLTVAIGCTGGRHRSVAVAEELGHRIAGWGYTVHVRHRDVHR